MSEDNERILSHIDWCIDSDVNNALSKDSQDELTPEELSTVVFQEDVTISFLMNDTCTFYVDRVLKGPSTLLQLLTFILNFYTAKMEPEIQAKAFEGRVEFLDDVLYDTRGSVKNVDTFDTCCGLPFLGLLYNADKNVYMVEIGPE